MLRTFIRFQLHTVRTDKEGFAPVKVVYELQGKVDRKFLSTNKKIRPLNWQNGRAFYLSKDAIKKYPDVNHKDLPTKKDIDIFNAELMEIETELRAIEKNFEFAGKNFTLSDVINEYKERHTDKPQVVKPEPTIYITDFIESYILRNQNLINAGTLKTYGSLLSQLKKFGAKKKDRLTFSGLSKARLNDLLRHYINAGCNNSYTSKHFSILKSLIREAIAENDKLVVNQAFRDYKPTILKNEDADVISLLEDEFNALMNLDLSDYSKYATYTKKIGGKDSAFNVSFKTLEKVRNLFLFSCATGFRFSDLMDLRREHIQDGWIRKRQVKGNKVHINKDII